jgi:myosin heavy subunit
MLNFYATSIQKNLLAYSKRRQYLAMRRSALVIQTKWRAYYQRKKYRQILDGIKRLQSILRSHQLVATFNSLRERICYFQVG